MSTLGSTDGTGLCLEGLCFAYPGHPSRLFDGLDWHVPVGRLVAVMGGSGSGKSTLLRLIAGLDHPHSGRVSFGSELFFGGPINRPPEGRGVGLVFQDGAVFPHMTVLDNVLYGLGSWPRKLRKERALQVLEMLEMQEFLHRRPHQLSGGQLQRVAIARSLAPQPRLLMLDEPFSSLDEGLRERIIPLVVAALKQTQTTTILVTHDAKEAHSAADEVWLLGVTKGAVVRAPALAEM